MVQMISHNLQGKNKCCITNDSQSCDSSVNNTGEYQLPNVNDLGNRNPLYEMTQGVCTVEIKSGISFLLICDNETKFYTKPNTKSGPGPYEEKKTVGTVCCKNVPAHIFDSP
jgi:hypothetical protein